MYVFPKHLSLQDLVKHGLCQWKFVLEIGKEEVYLQFTRETSTSTFIAVIALFCNFDCLDCQNFENFG